MRKKRLLYNTISSVAYQIITIICGFILPRMILIKFGSEINGLLSSITQFLSFITLMDAGVGAVVQSAYYKPLADGDNRQTNILFNYSKRHYRLLALILLAYVAVLCFVLPLTVDGNFPFFFVVSLVIILAFNSFAQFFFCAPYQLLLNADQRSYIQFLIQSIALIASTIIGVALILFNFPIYVVKIGAALVFLLQPIAYFSYFKKNYSLSSSIVDRKYKLPQRWNGFAQHCATVVMNNTDVIVLTVFSSLSMVSIYSVYNLVVYGIRQIVSSFSNGFNSLLGNLFASNEKEKLNKTFKMFEWSMHTMAVYIYSLTGMLLVPFVMNYTKGINDAQYYQPLFAVIITLAQAVFCLRIPYNTMVCSAGHYKQTQASAIIEMVINLGVSIALVKPLGLIGIALGTLLAMLYRTIYLVFYLKKNILHISVKTTLLLLVTDLIQAGSICLIHNCVSNGFSLDSSFTNWILYAIRISLISAMIIIPFNLVVYRDNIKDLKVYVFRKKEKKCLG